MTTDLDIAVIVLVGLCNEDLLLQELIGTIVFREDGSGKMEPQLISVQIGEDEGTPRNPFKPTFAWKMKGQYGFSYPVARGDGVMINLDAVKGKYSFSTGLGRGSSGSSGPISNGGPELAAALDKLFEFV